MEQEDYIEGRETVLVEPILSREGEITTIEEVSTDEKGEAQKTLPSSSVDEVHGQIVPFPPETNRKSLSQTSMAQTGSTESGVTKSQCQNCGNDLSKCLDNKPVHFLDKAPVNVWSSGLYWGKKKQALEGLVLEILEPKAEKSQRVKVQLGSRKSAIYPLTPAAPQAAGQPIFTYRCSDRCSDTGTPLTSTSQIPFRGTIVEAVGTFWSEKKRGRKGKIVHIGPEEDTVTVIWDDESNPAKRVQYKLISNLAHAKGVHIFNMPHM